jgi:hypothetical protein
LTAAGASAATAAASASAAFAAAAGSTVTAGMTGFQMASLAATAIGAVASGYGMYRSSQAQKQAGEAQSQVAKNNAKISEWNARGALAAGNDAELQNRRKYAQMEGSQRASLASRGLDLGEGSPLAILDDTQLIGEIDSDRIRFNAQQDAWGYRAQGTSYQAQANMSSAAAHNESPWLSGGSSLLTSATSVADKWYRYRRGLY